MMVQKLFVVGVALILVAGFVACSDDDVNSGGLEYTLITGGAEYCVASGNASTGDLVIPSSYNGKPVTAIGDSAFELNSDITSVKLPSTIRSIGESAFSSCYLTAINLPEGITNIGRFAFTSARIKAITIPATVTKLNGYTFRDCYSLATVSLPSTLEFVGISDFEGCTKIQAISLPANLKRIGTLAFGNAEGLTNITIPAMVTNIGSYTFANCYSLRTVFANPPTPPSAGGLCFNNITGSLSIKVPAASVTAYKSAYGWNSYSSKIVSQ